MRRRGGDGVLRAQRIAGLDAGGLARLGVVGMIRAPGPIEGFPFGRALRSALGVSATQAARRLGGRDDVALLFGPAHAGSRAPQDVAVASAAHDACPPGFAVPRGGRSRWFCFSSSSGRLVMPPPSLDWSS